MAQKKKKTKNEIENLSFEQAIEQLTQVVDKIETGQVPLAESLEQYEKGMAMIAHCRKILLDAEKRIEKIAESDDTDTADEDSDEDGPDEESEDDESLF